MDVSMLELFKAEAAQQSATLTEALASLRATPEGAELLEGAMRAAHSIKGAARLVGAGAVAKLAGVLEEYFVAAQAGRVRLSAAAADALGAAVELLAEIGVLSGDLEPWLAEKAPALEARGSAVSALMEAAASGGQPAAGDGAALKGATVLPPPVSGREASGQSLHDMSMLELFRVEAEQQSAVLNEGLLALEQDPASPERLEPLMRAAHSIKGAARLLDIQLVVQLAHVMEDLFVAAQKGALLLDANRIDVLLEGVDLIVAVAQHHEGSLAAWLEAERGRFDGLVKRLNGVLAGERPAAVAPRREDEAMPLPEVASAVAEPAASEGGAPLEQPQPAAADKRQPPAKERVLRISAEQLNRLMGLAGESLVESRWIYPYAESLLRLKRQQTELVCLIDTLREQLDSARLPDGVSALVRNAQKQASYCREILADRMAELESFDRRATNLSSRLHREVVKSRMRPFGDGVHGFPRMVRDIAKALGKEVQFVVEGANTLVDRDILDKMEASLNHLIRNAIDHGFELPHERLAAGKGGKGTLRLHAYHHAGMLSIVVEDDGRGVDLERLRQKIVAKGLIDQAMSATLCDEELLEFLFLPSFSTRDQVSEISGRGVGLDVVHDAVHEMRGNVRIVTELGKGTRFHMQLPLTLSVVPALIVDIAEEPYAFPLARIDRIVRIDKEMIEEAEGNQFVRIDGKNIGLVHAAQILERQSLHPHDARELSVVVLADRSNYYGMVVDRFMGERELVVQVMPAILGKVQDISAAALMEDGSPVLIVDVDDLVRSIEKILKVARINKVHQDDGEQSDLKRVLVVDDSITVREVERKMIEAAGYHVDTAVDGMDGLNMLRSFPYDLLVTDVDMPRMNGIELVKTVRQDPSLRGLPVMMVSYKDREEDRMRGLEAGADYYLTKGSLHDETLRQAVVDLIGEGRR